MKTINRAHFDTVGIFTFNTTLGNNKWHLFHLYSSDRFRAIIIPCSRTMKKIKFTLRGLINSIFADQFNDLVGEGTTTAEFDHTGAVLLQAFKYPELNLVRHFTLEVDTDTVISYRV